MAYAPHSSLHILHLLPLATPKYIEQFMYFKATVLEVIRFLSFFLIVFKNCYGIGNNVWKFQVSTMKIVPVAHIWSLCIIRIIMTQRFRRGDNIW